MTLLRDTANESLAGQSGSNASPVAFGKPARALFDFAATYRPLNHGSYGSVPRPVREAREAYQRRLEARVDIFRRFEEPDLVVRTRTALRDFLGPDVHVDEVGIVTNATTGVQVVVSNLASGWAKETASGSASASPPAVLYFNTIYGACLNTLRAEAEIGRVVPVCIDVDYLVDDADALVAKLRAGHADAVARGLQPRLALFETIVSMPGIQLPWERLVAASRDLGVLSLVDGAHGIGQIDLTHLGSPDIQPDFFVSNCHKWLFAPRGCAIFYVPFRNQHLLTTSMPTSHSYRLPANRPAVAGPSTSAAPNYFVYLFGDTGTADYTSYFAAMDAIAFRRDVCGGELAIREYCTRLSVEGGDRVAAMLGTEILTNHRSAHSSLRPCAMVNVRLPVNIPVGLDETASTAFLQEIWAWMQKEMYTVYDTFIPASLYQGALWARLSAQIFLDLEDFEWAGQTLLGLCERINRGDWNKTK